MFWNKLFAPKSLKEHLGATKTIKIKGILFKIKKIDVMDHLEGSKVMVQMYQTYEEKRAQEKSNLATNTNLKKVKSHLIDVILAGTIKPKLSRKEETSKIHIDELFNDWEIAEALYGEIMAHTYGKKKLMSTPRF